MNDFILPGDIEGMMHQVSSDISEAWDRLYALCLVKQYAFSLAEVAVHAYSQTMSELEAIHMAYREIATR